VSGLCEVGGGGNGNLLLSHVVNGISMFVMVMDTLQTMCLHAFARCGGSRVGTDMVAIGQCKFIICELEVFVVNEHE